MHAENGLLVNMQEIETVVSQADVFAIGFRLFPERLLIDTRFDVADPSGSCGLPMVAIVDPVESLQERYFWLGQRRPSVGMPDNFSFFNWPHSIQYLEESGLWARVRERVESSGFAGSRETCVEAMRDLFQRERAATIEAILGTRHETIWSARGR